MIRRLLLGVIEGLLLGAVLFGAIVHGAPAIASWMSGWLGYPLAALTGVLTGLIAGKAIWQRDANSYALRSLEHCASPARILNVTGAEAMTVRSAADFFAERFGRPCAFRGEEGDLALLSESAAAHALMGPPSVNGARLMEMVADWVGAGGESLNKPTHFEVSDGKF